MRNPACSTVEMAFALFIPITFGTGAVADLVDELPGEVAPLRGELDGLAEAVADGLADTELTGWPDAELLGCPVGEDEAAGCDGAALHALMSATRSAAPISGKHRQYGRRFPRAPGSRNKRGLKMDRPKDFARDSP